VSDTWGLAKVVRKIGLVDPIDSQQGCVQLTVLSGESNTG